MNPAIWLLALSLQATSPPSPQIVTPTPSAGPSVAPAPSPAAALTASLAVANLHPSQPLTISVAHARGALNAQLDLPLAAVTVDSAAQTVTLTAGTQTGRAVLTVSDATGAAVQIPVRVALDAGVVPQTLQLRVTGTAIDPAWLRRQIQRVLSQSVQLQPGASMQPGQVTLPDTLGPGASAAIPVAVQIAGGTQYYDVSGTAGIDLQNVDAPAFLPPLLFYDDDPEKLVSNGVLFRNMISAASPTRLYYYHENAGGTRHLVVALSGAGTVQLIDASAGPNIDVMSVGHAVSRDFLSQKPRNEGVVVEVSPDAPYVADAFLLGPLDGAAGSIGMRVLSGGPVDVTVAAVPPEASGAEIAAALQTAPLPDDGHHRTGVFSLTAYASDSIAYTAGSPAATLEYGASSPPPAGSASGHDYGEYGVLRTVVFNALNPYRSAATAYLYERPLGGPVRSSFLVDGNLLQLGCARVPNRYQIGPPISLMPGKTSITVQTMTDGGSNYPIELGLGGDPPQPSTPAISAPDGCFPKPQTQPLPSGSPAPSPVPSAGRPF